MAEAGSRFEGYVREAMREVDMSLAELARQSGVKETNWHTWFRGEHQPRRNSLALAARPLRRTPEQLLAAWDGERPSKRKAPSDPVVQRLDRIIELLEEMERAFPQDVDLDKVARAWGGEGPSSRRDGRSRRSASAPMATE